MIVEMARKKAASSLESLTTRYPAGWPNRVRKIGADAGEKDQWVYIAAVGMLFESGSPRAIADKVADYLRKFRRSRLAEKFAMTDEELDDAVRRSFGPHDESGEAEGRQKDAASR